MLISLLPVIVITAPFVIAIFLIYRFVSKKAGKIMAIAFGALLLVMVLFVSFLYPSKSSTDNGAASTGEKTLSQVVERNFPGVKYTIEEGMVTMSEDTVKRYEVRITTRYDEAAYLKFNKDACMQLNEPAAQLYTTVSEGRLAPQSGKGGSCKYWLAK